MTARHHRRAHDWTPATPPRRTRRLAYVIAAIAAAVALVGTGIAVACTPGEPTAQQIVNRTADSPNQIADSIRDARSSMPPCGGQLVCGPTDILRGQNMEQQLNHVDLPRRLHPE